MYGRQRRVESRSEVVGIGNSGGTAPAAVHADDHRVMTGKRVLAGRPAVTIGPNLGPMKGEH